MQLKEYIRDKWWDIKIFFKNRWEDICRYCTGIKRWIVYFPTIVEVYDFDWSSILIVEKKQLERLRDNIKRYHSHVNADRDIEKINLALRLLNIVLEGAYVNLIGDFTDHKWKFNNYVNTKNAERFCCKSFAEYLKSSKSKNIFELLKSDLYEEKAWKLYNEIRYRYLQQWWD